MKKENKNMQAVDKPMDAERSEILDYEVIDEKTENSDFHIRFMDGNC